MSFVADLSAIGSAVFVALFSLWMIKQLFSDNN